MRWLNRAAPLFGLDGALLPPEAIVKPEQAVAEVLTDVVAIFARWGPLGREVTFAYVGTTFTFLCTWLAGGPFDATTCEAATETFPLLFNYAGGSLDADGDGLEDLLLTRSDTEGRVTETPVFHHCPAAELDRAPFEGSP
ncbi:MAG: hypothetical protein IPG04_33645 [Polyangiaceae bacterium]|nr:hypothetical protein [Polyangiaceae bacterium]